VVSADPEDIAWLVGPQAARLLSECQRDRRSLVQQTTSLRRQWGAARTHLLLEQVALRTRAAAKFVHADRMYFTARLLEQATDEVVADYKARRFQQLTPVADLCCGMGGDLLAIARKCAATGVDRDPVALQFARANCHACGLSDVRLQAADVAGFAVADFAAWHVDPDRRAGPRRSSRIELGTPGPEVLRDLLTQRAHAAVKLAPAAAVPVDWGACAEREWIGSRRECRQQVLWFGRLARAPGRCTATVVEGNREPTSFHGDPEIHLGPAASLGRYIVEPHAAVLAARLAGALAQEADLRPVLERCAYLTGDAPLVSPLTASFEVMEVLPFDLKRIKAALRARGVGRLEVKVRGAHADPAQIRRRLRVSGDASATLLLAGNPRETLSILTRRCPTP
jgi:SAM-dependent methyltransferase